MKLDLQARLVVLLAPTIALWVACHGLPTTSPGTPPTSPQASPPPGGAYQRHAVASDQPLASQAGARLLAQGGNAADAAAATMLALGVVNPSSSGLGGGGFALYYQASDKSLHFLDFRERAPGRASAEMFQARPGEADEQARMRSRLGGLAVGVPGEPAGIEKLVREFGSLEMARIAGPAVELARGGFVAGNYLARAIGLCGPELLSGPGTEDWPGEPSAGAVLRSPKLARTLETFAKHGADAFYRGPLGSRLVQAVQQAGGVLQEADLDAYRVVRREPLSGTALGKRWVSAPPPSAGGYTLLASLRILEALRRQQPGMLTDPVLRAHALVESWKGPYLDRARYFGDPDQVKLPMEALAATGRTDARARLVRHDRAQAPTTYELPLEAHDRVLEQPDNAGTSHLCVVDDAGNIAAVTTTVNLLFGSQVGSEGLWLNNEMDDFAREVGKANAFGLVGGSANLPGPGKRPVSSMSPTIVLGASGPELCIGASGGSRIITAVQQVAMGILLDGATPEQAVRAPRLHHQASPDEVQTLGITEPVRIGLEARGHKLVQMRSPAHVQVVSIEASSGLLRAASDPTKGGAPAGQ